jgi:3-phosphoshikimate 1-carboxyvinyltransferase
MSTIAVFKALGVTIHDDGKDIFIEGKGFEQLQEPKEILDAGNSGTTMRLAAIVLIQSSALKKL